MARISWCRWLACVGLAVLFGEVVGDERGARPGRDIYAQARVAPTNRLARPAPATNPVAPPSRMAQPNRGELETTPRKFRDIPLNTEFFFVADRQRRLFPKIKISPTSALSIPSAAVPYPSTNRVAPEALVLVRQGAIPQEASKPPAAEPKSKAPLR